MKTREHEMDHMADEYFIEPIKAHDDGSSTIRFTAFDTIVDIKAYAESGQAAAALKESIALCRTYERLFSRTLAHSDITRINNAGGRAVEIDKRTYDLLMKALHYCADSEGVFDITIGPVVALWDFKRGVTADALKLSEAVQHVDWHTLKLREDAGDTDNPRYFAHLDDGKAALDVGGIAKGWIADALTDTLSGFDLKGLMVNLGGNVAVRGAKPDGSLWNIGIRDPRCPSQLVGTIPFSQGSVVTSGTYERSFIANNGTSYHHILDPRTGMPVNTDVAGVTLLCDRSIDAEGFSTTLLALGKERGLEKARRTPEITQAIFVDTQGVVTPAFR